MRPRGQTPRMSRPQVVRREIKNCFNEAAGADPADAAKRALYPGCQFRFNEAAGADPADATSPPWGGSCSTGFNEAAGADPADAAWAAIATMASALLQ